MTFLAWIVSQVAEIGLFGRGDCVFCLQGGIKDNVVSPMERPDLSPKMLCPLKIRSSKITLSITPTPRAPNHHDLLPYSGQGYQSFLQPLRQNTSEWLLTSLCQPPSSVRFLRPVNSSLISLINGSFLFHSYCYQLVSIYLPGYSHRPRIGFPDSRLAPF